MTGSWGMQPDRSQWLDIARLTQAESDKTEAASRVLRNIVIYLIYSQRRHLTNTTQGKRLQPRAEGASAGSLSLGCQGCRAGGE
ncbi:hypothetical protein GZ78_28615 [Endozoicomonas numazuensis]|uniref:Uncharacterized protein n=1 Tax=Endozoicomonas numazuensis TaxID=1137799 RepID=A0A081MZY0_9GAMM|nr:hypothetical protein GZ78_28615 [Endozoicomonas numazuensis]